MNTDPREFRDLQKLLAWKRHEQPPPSYFFDFSQQVIGRIQCLNTQPPPPWWSRWLQLFDARPVLVGAYGLAVCGLLITGLTAVQTQEEARPLIPAHASWANLAILPAVIDNHTALARTLAYDEPNWPSSVEPLITSQPDRYGFSNDPAHLRPVNFTLH